MKYSVIFLDLDNTVYDFSASSREAYGEVYRAMDYDRFFPSFDAYMALYETRNAELWTLYNAGSITKDELNAERYLHPLRVMGVEGAERISQEFFHRAMKVLPTKGILIPHALEALRYLRPRYRLFILSNGFAELQTRKMQSAGIYDFFEGIVLSEDIGVNKPDRRLFDHALRVAGVASAEALMVGDDFDVDIAGAREAGWDQMYFARSRAARPASLPFVPTYEIHSLAEVPGWL